MIFGPLEQDKNIIQSLFADRWSQFTSYGGGLQDFTFVELRRAYELMISDMSKKFLFLIDGLDEMDEYSPELIDLIIVSTRKENVKLCVSSRPSPVFSSAFETRPRLVLDEYNQGDIHSYVKNTVNMEERLQSLRGKLDEETEAQIVSSLANKASGVFLWAVLATTFILQGIQEGDDFLIIKDRVDALPYQLDDLFAHMINKFQPADLEQLWKVYTLLEAQTCPSILPFSFALTAETSATLAADVRPLKATEISKRVEDVRAVLRLGCKGFFAIFDTTHPEQQGVPPSPAILKVTYTHRTVRDYLISQPTLFNTLPPSAKSLNATQQWANAHLWTLKTLEHQTTDNTPLEIWTPLSYALTSVPLIFADQKKYPLTYTDAALSTAVFLHLNSTTDSDLPFFPSAPATSILTSLDLAVLLNMQIYVAIKAKTADRKDVRHAIDFHLAMRKRLGAGGEAKWLDGAGRGQLRADYTKVRTELDALLEYYAKAMRFGSAKAFIEIPEYV